jgi:hypothetical protein
MLRVLAVCCLALSLAGCAPKERPLDWAGGGPTDPAAAPAPWSPPADPFAALSVPSPSATAPPAPAAAAHAHDGHAP